MSLNEVRRRLTIALRASGGAFHDAIALLDIAEAVEKAEAGFREEHYRVNDPVGMGFCPRCEVPWPCTVGRILSALEKLRQRP